MLYKKQLDYTGGKLCFSSSGNYHEFRAIIFLNLGQFHGKGDLVTVINSQENMKDKKKKTVFLLL